MASPTDLIKTQIQMEGRRRLMGEPPRVNGMMDAFRWILIGHLSFIALLFIQENPGAGRRDWSMARLLAECAESSLGQPRRPVHLWQCEEFHTGQHHVGGQLSHTLSVLRMCRVSMTKTSSCYKCDQQESWMSHLLLTGHQLCLPQLASQL